MLQYDWTAGLGQVTPDQTVIQTLLDYYRISVDSLGDISLTASSMSSDIGFFQFGEKSICYGRCQSGVAAAVAGSGAFDASKSVRRDGSTIQLPFDFTEVVDNLRLERYRQKKFQGMERFAVSEPVRQLYYLIRGCLPVSVRRQLQRAYFLDWKRLSFPAWPVDFTVDTLHEEFLRLLMETRGVKKVPFIWFWPEGAPNCLIMTHDVETSAGRDFAFKLMDLDDSYGIKASFQVIPEKRYEVTDEYVRDIRSHGCEFNIHDLNHDGHLYRERAEFVRRAARINGYMHRYGSRGFSRWSDVSQSRMVRCLRFFLRHVRSERCSSGTNARRLLHGYAVFHRQNRRASSHRRTGLFALPHLE